MEFTSIKDYETYGINKNGEVKDLRNGNIKDQFIRNTQNCQYRFVNLQNPSGTKPFMVHRLVAITFIENPHNYSEVDHIDRNKDNNNIDNLRWADRIIQSNNRNPEGWSKKGYPKYITYEELSTKKNPYACWVFQIRSKIYGSHKKRFKTSEFTLEDVIKYKEEYLSKFILN